MRPITVQEYAAALKRGVSSITKKKLDVKTINAYVAKITPYIEQKKFPTDKKILIQYMNEELKRHNSAILRSAFSKYLELVSDTRTEERTLKSLLDPVIVQKSALRDKSLMDKKGLVVEQNIKTLINNAHSLKAQALFALLFDTGCRRAEALGIKRKHIRLYKRGRIAAKINIVGKRGLARTVYLSNATLLIIKRYCEAEEIKPDDYLFRFNGAQDLHNQGVLMTQFVVREAQKVLGDGVHVTPHMFRHACGIHLRRKGADQVDIQKYLGHLDVSTTSIYTAGYDDTRGERAANFLFK